MHIFLQFEIGCAGNFRDLTKISNNFIIGTMVYDNKGLGEDGMLIDIDVFLINQKMCDVTEIQNCYTIIIIACSIINQYP